MAAARALAGAALVAAVGAAAIVVLRDVHPARAFIAAALVFTLVGTLLVPVAWAEERAQRRFARLDAHLRQRLGDAAAREVALPEGHGIAYAVAEGRDLVLLRPAAGIGAPHALDPQGRRVVVREPEDLRDVLGPEPPAAP